jgi:dCMP deaminase
VIDTKWDARFLDLAQLVASWSKDPSTKTGAVIVRPDRTIASVGYNGFPRSMSDANRLYEDREQKYSRIVHCEVNALIHAHEPVRGYTLYTWPFLSCDRCFVQLAQAGITRFVAPRCPEHLRERWEPTFAKTRQYALEMNLQLDEI